MRRRNRRSREKWAGRRIGRATIVKELATLRAIWNWARKQRYLDKEPPFGIGDLRFARIEDRHPYRTSEAIRKTIERGGLTREEETALWESLYLTLDEVHEVLSYVREESGHPFIYPMVAFAAMTGVRRSEICRSRIEDWDLENRTVKVREKKRKPGRSSYRVIDVNEILAEAVGEWLDRHPGGQHLITRDGNPLTVKMASSHLKRVLRHYPTWRCIPGFHTFRHSFASILASRGVDETTIDRWMGHQTQEQRERYRHLFPKNRKRAIELLSLPARA